MKIKYLKLAVLSFFSWLIYFWVENSKMIESFSEQVNRVNSSRGFGVLTFMYLGKYFLLMFGIVSIIFLIIKFFNK